MKLRRETAKDSAARFLASYERRAGKLAAEPTRRRQLGAIVKVCHAAGHPVPMWVRIQLFTRRTGR